MRFKKPCNIYCLVFALIAGSSLTCFIWFAHNHKTTNFDDAYAFLRYAKHFLAGHGFSWNIHEGPAFGCTSSFYLYVVTALRWCLNIPDGQLLVRVSLSAGIAACLTVCLVCHYALNTAKELQRTGVALLVIPALLVSEAFWFHCLSGMDTTLSFLCNAVLCLAVMVYVKHPSSARMIWCVAAGVASFNVRPDNGLAVLLVPALFFLVAIDNGRRHSLHYLIFIGLALIGNMFINVSLFGSFLPLPVFAKHAGVYGVYLGVARWNAGQFLLGFIRAAFPFLMCIALFVNNRSYLRLAALLVPVCMTCIYYFTVTQIMGWQFRFYFPAMPFIAAAAFVAMGLFFRHEPLPHASQSDWFMRIPFLLILCFVMVPGLSDRFSSGIWTRYFGAIPAPVIPQTRYMPRTQDILPQLGWWQGINAMQYVANDLPDGSVVAMSEHGYIGASAPNVNIIDLVGLHDRNLTKNGFSAEYVISKRPDIIWFPHPDYSSLVAKVLDNKRFQSEFAYYPRVFDYGIAVSKNSAGFGDVMSSVRAEFRKVYPGRDIKDYLAEPIN